jgi:ketosteroid isomerase-like protein
VQRLVDAFNRDDIRAVLAIFDENCEIDEPPEMPDSPAMGYRGHDGVREWMGNLREVGGVSFELRSATPRGEVLFELRADKIGRIRVFLRREEALEASL